MKTAHEMAVAILDGLQYRFPQARFKLLDTRAVEGVIAEAQADVRRAALEEATAQLCAEAQRRLDQARKFMRGGDERSEELNRQIGAALEAEADKILALLSK